jgi:nickel/cobalt transporter (NicO) family protein
VSRVVRSAAVLGVAVGGLVLLPATTAAAHPLGNFSVNHYDGLTLWPDRVDDLAVVDTAEIPTVQDKAAADTSADGTVSTAERQRYAVAQCAAVAAAITAERDGERLLWTVLAAELDYHPGAAGLPTSRLSCSLTARADLRRPATVTLRDGFRADRVGWHEITARGDGVALPGSPAPVRSVSDELRRYPADLLSSPLGERSVTLAVRPGTAAESVATVALPSAGPLTTLLARADGAFTDLVGSRHLTPLVGALAVLLSLLLGAAHAALPGHGKTVMAAYLAGRRGSRRDALVVGATVTLTHTAGVLVLGLLLSVSAALAGEAVLNLLSVLSGLMIAAIGLALLRTAVRDRRAARTAGRGDAAEPGRPAGPTPADEPGPAAEPARAAQLTHAAGPPDAAEPAHAHTPERAHAAAHAHGVAPGHGHAREHAAAHVHAIAHGHGHEDGHAHGHAHDGVAHGHAHDDGVAHGDGHADGHGHGHEHAHGHGHVHDDGVAHRHGHAHPNGAAHAHGRRRPHTHPAARRAGLVGMGVAGGLVPSPSALVVLLGAIALGRTVFGVVLVLGYGLGMAATLTAAGLLLVHLRSRLDTRPPGRWGRPAAAASRLLPTATATLVVLVGATLAARGLGR